MKEKKTAFALYGQKLNVFDLKASKKIKNKEKKINRLHAYQYKNNKSSIIILFADR